MQASTNGKTFHLYVSYDGEARPYTMKLILQGIKQRGFDILVSSIVMLSILIWLIPIVALLIKLTSPGPAMFIQSRTGRNGRVFPCLKFRTMTYDRDAQFQQA